MERSCYIHGNLISPSSALATGFQDFGQKISYVKGVPLFRQGECISVLYYIVKGGVSTYILDSTGKRKVVDITLGRCIIGIECIGGLPSITTCQCVDHTTLYALGMERIPFMDKEFLLELLSESIYRSIRLQAQLRIASTADSRSILDLIIHEYSQVQTELHGDSTFKLTQQVLGELSGLSRVQISNLLRKLSSD